MIVIENYHIKLGSDFDNVNFFELRMLLKRSSILGTFFCGVFFRKTIGRDQLAYISTVSFA